MFVWFCRRGGYDACHEHHTDLFNLDRGRFHLYECRHHGSASDDDDDGYPGDHPTTSGPRHT